MWMSTRGILIIRRDGKEKAMDIRSDAYPSGAGVDIVDLIKTTDLNALFEAMTEADEWDIPEWMETFPDEPDAFSYSRCRLAVKHRKGIWVFPETADRIRDSLFCEYAYVIDLRQEELLLFVGGQTQLQENNPYGVAGKRYPEIKETYYACRLCAVFSFRYIRTFSTEQTAGDMERAEKEREILKFETDPSGDEVPARNMYAIEKKRLISALNGLEGTMKCLAERLEILQITSKNRLRNLNGAVSAAKDAFTKLEMQIEVMA